nr:PhnD/SsuA/transferrin family substrate-binding protein [Rubricella aquisinus]
MHLTRGADPLRSLWSAPDLRVSQCCGWHVVSGHIGAAQVFARPVWDIADLTPGSYASVIIVRAEDRDTPLDRLLSAAVINSEDSWSGCHVFRHWLGGQGRVLERALVSGAHRASIAAVREGRGDIAAIDIASFTLAVRLGETEGVHVLARTAEFPSVPFIHGAGIASPLALAALKEAMAQDAAAPFREALSLQSIMPATPALYDKMATVAAKQPLICDIPEQDR